MLNGAPRAGKSALVDALQRLDDEPWLNLGVDVLAPATPEVWKPGIGLRPGTDRPDLAHVRPRLFRGLFASWAAFSREGISVVADVGIHSDPDLWHQLKLELRTLPHGIVGVRCDPAIALDRRARTGYPVDRAMAERWEEAVHRDAPYDLEVDGGGDSDQAAQSVLAWLAHLRAA